MSSYNSAERRALKRVWNPPSRNSAEPRILRPSPSLPQSELLRGGRLVFECASCGFSHERGVPICLWCQSTDGTLDLGPLDELPRQRTLSAPKPCYIPPSSVSESPTPSTSSTPEPQPLFHLEDPAHAPVDSIIAHAPAVGTIAPILDVHDQSHIRRDSRHDGRLIAFGPLDNGTLTKAHTLDHFTPPMQILPFPPESSMHYHYQQDTRQSFEEPIFNSRSPSPSYAPAATRPPTPHLDYSSSLSRPSSPDSMSFSTSSCGTQKYGAYVARKSAQRQSFLAQIAEQASIHAIRPDTLPVDAPMPGAVALGLLLPIQGALDLPSDFDPRRSSITSTRRFSSRRDSGVPSLVFSESTRNSTSESRRASGISTHFSASTRPSLESSRRVRFSSDLPPPREGDSDSEPESPTVSTESKLSLRSRLSRMARRVSNVFRRGSKSNR